MRKSGFDGPAVMESPIVEYEKGFVDRRAEEHGAVMAFSARNGGCSPGPMNSLNFSVREGDSDENVEKNLKVFSDFLRISPSKIVQIDQQHGDGIATVSDKPDTELVADALIVAEPGIFAAVKTADCVPVLLMDPVLRICAAVHAGWRGTVSRIALKVIRKLEKEFGVAPENLLVSIGPSIGACCYEVDDRVLIPLSTQLPHARRFIRKFCRGTPDGTVICQSIDLSALNKSELLTSGVKLHRIQEAGLCTSCHESLFFSHRRDGGITGRHIAVVGFRN